MNGNYPFFQLEKFPENKTAILYFNRPEKLNAMSWNFWRDLPAVIREIEADQDIVAVVIAGRGKSFTVGLDVIDFLVNNAETLSSATVEARERLLKLILLMQQGFRAIAAGEKIYIAAIHNYCIGAGLDIAVACDLRLATADAVFSLRETKIAIVADMGSLNRLPLIIGHGNARLMAYTGRNIPASQALSMGLVNEIYENQELLIAGASRLAGEIAANSAAAVRGTKKMLHFMESHSPDEGLDYVAAWNAAFLNMQEIEKAIRAALKNK
ncbi:MAG TPA: enoyl-CoA hydratase-related protein [Smithellaceae bacterium]|nr:enoyl-CoA hydratase-related protein [Smithellaceae bacterium]